MSAEHGDNELELGPDDILVDGLLMKGIKDQSQLEVAIGDGMEFTIHGDLKSKKGKMILNNVKVRTVQNATTQHTLFGYTKHKPNIIYHTKTKGLILILPCSNTKLVVHHGNISSSIQHTHTTLPLYKINTIYDICTQNKHTKQYCSDDWKLDPSPSGQSNGARTQPSRYVYTGRRHCQHEVVRQPQEPPVQGRKSQGQRRNDGRRREARRQQRGSRHGRRYGSERFD